MRVGIHQPNFLPWLGYFYKIKKSDIFVFLDDVPFSKGSYTNRAKILIDNKKKWLTVPVITSHRLGQSIQDVEIIENDSWRNKIMGLLQQAYGKHKYYEEFVDTVKNVIIGCSRNLADINISLIKGICNFLDIKTNFIRSSELKIQGKSTALLVDLCKRLNANCYISGLGAKTYQDEDFFLKNDIDIEYSDFQHPIYSQGTKEFLFGLSIVDMLFREGNIYS